MARHCGRRRCEHGRNDGIGTSVKMIDRTYGHLVAGADVYERELLDAFDAGPERLGRYGGHGGRERCGLTTTPKNDKSLAVAGLSERRERRDSNPRPPA